VAALVSFAAAFAAIYDSRIMSLQLQTSFLAIALFVAMLASYFLVMTGLLCSIQCWNSNPALYHAVGTAFYFLSLLFFMGTLAWTFLYFLIFQSQIVTALQLNRVPIFCIWFAMLFAAITVAYTCIGRRYREDTKKSFIQFELQNVSEVCKNKP
jgi:hypothetical protein